LHSGSSSAGYDTYLRRCAGHIKISITFVILRYNSEVRQPQPRQLVVQRDQEGADLHRLYADGERWIVGVEPRTVVGRRRRRRRAGRAPRVPGIRSERSTARVHRDGLLVGRERHLGGGNHPEPALALALALATLARAGEQRAQGDGGGRRERGVLTGGVEVCEAEEEAAVVVGSVVVSQRQQLDVGWQRLRQEGARLARAGLASGSAGGGGGGGGEGKGLGNTAERGFCQLSMRVFLSVERKRAFVFSPVGRTAPPRAGASAGARWRPCRRPGRVCPAQ
jgi:hypothetical protein